MTFNIKDLQHIFSATFETQYKTQLLFGADEPFYQAAKLPNENNQIFSRSDFFASALHEISHWCIAGEKRRKLDDFGYWYNPDGRNLEEQKKFETFEVKPQALEKAFSLSCNYPFQVSVDNLAMPNYDASPFIEKVNIQMLEYQKNGFPKRAAMFIYALSNFYNTNKYNS